MTTSTPLQSVDWSTGTHAGLVSIDPHNKDATKLYLSAAGPSRKTPTTPVVIIEAGMGSSSYEWQWVQASAAAFTRVYSYDRAGLGNSTAYTLPPSVQNQAKQLKALLDAAGVAPPYVTVGHSLGGLITREFLDLVGPGVTGVVGMVFVDAVQEKTWEEIDFTLWDVAKGEDIVKVLGLPERSFLTAEHWQALAKLEKAGEKTADEEAKHFGEGSALLGAKNQLEKQPLGDGKVSVIFGHSAEDGRNLLKWADAHDKDPKLTAKLREKLKDWDDVHYALQKEQLKLSSVSRIVETTGNGMTHNMQFTTPEIIVDEIRWVVGEN